MLFRIANSENPDQTASSVFMLLQKQSDLGLHCMPRPLWQATSVRNFRRLPYSDRFLSYKIRIYTVVPKSISFEGYANKNFRCERCTISFRKLNYFPKDKFPFCCY